MVALTFVDGRVHLRTRFVATKERQEEQEQRKLLYRGQMGTNPHGVIGNAAVLLKSFLTFSWPALRFRNPSNTNVFYWGGKVSSNDRVKVLINVSRILLKDDHYICADFDGV